MTISSIAKKLIGVNRCKIENIDIEAEGGIERLVIKARTYNHFKFSEYVTYMCHLPSYRSKNQVPFRLYQQEKQTDTLLHRGMFQIHV